MKRCMALLLIFALSAGMPAAGAAAAGAEAPLRALARELRRDARFPSLYQYVLGGWRMRADYGLVRRDGSDLPRGAVLRAVIHNDGDAAIECSDVLLNGQSLSEQIVLVPKRSKKQNLAAPPVTEAMAAAGEPVWYQVRPNPIPPGASAEVTVRLRHVPPTDSLPLVLKTSAGDWRIDVPAKADRVRISGVNFSGGIDRLYLYARADDGADFSLKGVDLDGRPVTLPAGAPARSSAGFLPIVLPLGTPWAHGSFHTIQLRSDAGEPAVVVRARDDFFPFGMWGYRRDGNEVEEQAANTARAFQRYLFNTHMLMGGGQTGFFISEPGLKLLGELKMRLMPRDPTKADVRSNRVYARFLYDEPDAHDAAVEAFPPERRLGAHGQEIVTTQARWTKSDPRNLCLLNIDNTYTPDNWLMYGQLPDILALDPYWIERLSSFYQRHPERVADAVSPIYVFAAADIARYASEPRPTHTILNSVSYRPAGEPPRRYPTPEEKRLEFYMALAAGAKGISYWWWTPYGDCFGAGSGEPAAVSMMKEIATLNAEGGALSPLLAASCPAAQAGSLDDPFVRTKPYWLLARSLCVGTDAVLVALVNRDHAADRVGTVYQPIEKATLIFTPPQWLKGDDLRVQRIVDATLSDVSVERDGERLRITLPDVKLGEMLLITADGELSSGVGQRLSELRPRLESVLADPP